MMAESLLCGKCDKAAFLVQMLDKELHIVCIDCGYISNINELAIESKEMYQLRKSKEGKK